MNKPAKWWVTAIAVAVMVSFLVRGKVGLFITTLVMFGIGWLVWRAYLLVKPASTKTEVVKRPGE